MVARITYSLGWILLLLGGLVHLNVGRTASLAMSLTKRNLFEISVVLFVICMASELRAHALTGSQASGIGRRTVAV